MPVSPARYRLTPRALRDLEDIWLYGAEAWSPDQADSEIDTLLSVFETIAAAPMLARERSEFAPPVRLHPHGSHLIVYVLSGEAVVIVRILGGRQDWRAILNIIDG